MKSYLFVYGTLLEPEVRTAVLGHCPPITRDKLFGFSMQTIRLDGINYPVITEDSAASEPIAGGYFSVSDEDFIKLDAYESDAYLRTVVTLESGVRAWVYYR